MQIHGLAGSAHWWDALVPLLSRSRRVIRIDLLGHGRSAKPAGPGYEIAEQGRRVGAALDRLGVKHATVVGHSTVGSVATALAEQRPLLPGVGHSPMLEDPAATAALLLAFTTTQTRTDRDRATARIRTATITAGLLRPDGAPVRALPGPGRVRAPPACPRTRRRPTSSPRSCRPPRR